MNGLRNGTIRFNFNLCDYCLYKECDFFPFGKFNVLIL